MRAITEFTTEKLFKRYKPEQLERAKIGYQKANEFIRRFVAAGGILKEGSDSPRGMAGLLMHEALVMDVEAGVPPMTAIQAATLNVARTFHKDKDFGSVEPGKVADLSIIEGDPLKDIWMTQNVKMVVMNGKLVDTAFTRYVNPIPEFNSWQQLSAHIEVSPLAVTQGSGPTTIKVSGKGFWPFHYVLLNGKELETRYVSRRELDAVVPPDMVANVGMYLVTVKSRGEPVAVFGAAPLVVGFKKKRSRAISASSCEERPKDASRRMPAPTWFRRTLRGASTMRSRRISVNVRRRGGVHIERRVQLDALDVHAAAGTAFAQFLGERAALRIAEPQPQQMPFALRLRPVLIFAPRVQRDEIVEELDVARLEIHVGRAFLHGRAVGLDGFLLHRGQGGTPGIL